MKTRGYKLTRIAVQLLAGATFITNAIIFGYLYLMDFSELELRLTKKPILLFCDLSLAITGVNILFSVASACCITSKIRPLMSAYESILYMQIAFACSAAVYYHFFYIDNVYTSLSMEFFTTNPGFASLLRGYNLVPVNGSLVTAFRIYMKHIVDLFCLVQLGISIGAYAQAKLFNYTANIELDRPSERIPRIENSKGVGCNRIVNYKIPIQREAAVPV